MADKAENNAENKGQDQSNHLNSIQENDSTLEELLTGEDKSLGVVGLSPDQSPLHYAAVKGNVAAIKYLLTTYEADVNADFEDGETPLHKAASSGNVEVLKLFIDNKGDTNVVDKLNGRRPFHKAAVCGHVEILQLLLSRETNVNVADHDGVTALHLAAAGGHRDAIKFLLDIEANANVKDKIGEMPSHYAAKYGHSEVLKCLIERGSDVKIADNAGNTALHLASAEGHCEAVKILLDHGLNVNYQNKQKRTSVHEATSRGHCEVFKILLDHGGDVSIVDQDNHTPMKVARGSCKNFYKMYSSLSDREIHLTKSSFYDRLTVNEDSESPDDEDDRIHLHQTGLIITECNSIYKNFELHFLRGLREHAGAYFSLQPPEWLMSDVFIVACFDNKSQVRLQIEIPSLNTVHTAQAVLAFSNGEQKKINKTRIEKGVTFFNVDMALKEGQIETFALAYIPEKISCTIDDDTKNIQTNVDPDFLLTVPRGAFPTGSTVNVQILDITGAEKTDGRGLISCIYAVEAESKIPKKPLTFQIPMVDSSYSIDDIIIVSIDENKLPAEAALELLPTRPMMVERNLIFQAECLSIKVACTQNMMKTSDDRRRLIREVQRTIGQSEVSFFVVGKDKGSNHMEIVVECCETDKCPKKIQRWLDDRFEQHSVNGTGPKAFQFGQEFEVTFPKDIETADQKASKPLKFRRHVYNYKRYSATFKRKKMSGQVKIVEVQQNTEKTNSSIKPYAVVLPIGEDKAVLDDESLKVLGTQLGKGKAEALANVLQIDISKLERMFKIETEGHFAHRVLLTWFLSSDDLMGDMEERLIEALKKIGCNPIAEAINKARDDGLVLREVQA